MADLKTKISALPAGTPIETDIIPYVDLVSGTTKKALKSELEGADGATVLNGTIDPTTEGVDGDFYINTTSWQIFGPKATTWGTGTNIIGPAGADGVIQTVVGGNNITVDITDPANPIINVDTLTSADISDLDTATVAFTNKTLNDISNNIHANATHFKAKATENILKGQPVTATGYNLGEGAYEVALANQATGVATGVAEEDINIGTFGDIILSGTLNDVDTSAFNDKDVLYVNGAGTYTTTVPTTGYIQQIAYVLRSNANNGALQINAQSPLQRAINVPYNNTISGLAATNVEAAIDEVEGRVDTLEANNTGTNTGDQTATTVPNTPAGNIVATDVQGAINELDSEKLALAGGTMTGAINMNTNQINNLASPSIGSDATNKDYVDNLVAGVKWKDEVEVATTANITLSGEQTIDGVLTSSSRVLVKDQTDQTTNGIYISNAGAWTRATDADTGIELVASTTKTTSGTTQANKVFVNNNDTITLGVTNITYVAFGNIVSHNNTTGKEGGGANFYHSDQPINQADSPSFAGLTVDTDTLAVDAVNNRVGIGTTTPSGVLDTVNAQGNILFRQDASAIDFTRPGTSYLRATDALGNFIITTGGTGYASPVLTLSATGNAGIGTAAPAAKLHIGGTAGVDGIKFPDGTLQTTASTGGTGLTLYDGVVAGQIPIGPIFETGCASAATLTKFKVSTKTQPTTDLIVKLYKNGVEDASVTIATTATPTNGLYVANDTTFVSGSYAEDDRITVEVISGAANNLAWAII